MVVRSKKIKTCAHCFRVIDSPAHAWKNVQKKDRMTELFFHVDCFDIFKAQTTIIEDNDEVQDTIEFLLGL